MNDALRRINHFLLNWLAGISWYLVGYVVVLKYPQYIGLYFFVVGAAIAVVARAKTIEKFDNAGN